MAIPAEQGLVKHYEVSFEANDGDTKTITYTVEGGLRDVDLSPQLQGQGIAVFVDNPSDVNMVIDIYAKIRVYDEEHTVFLESFTADPGNDIGCSTGFGLMKRDVEIHVTPDSAPSSAVDVVVAVVPTNG